MPNIKSIVPLGVGFGVVLDLPEDEPCGSMTILSAAELAKVKRDAVQYVVGELVFRDHKLTAEQLDIVRDVMSLWVADH